MTRRYGWFVRWYDDGLEDGSLPASGWRLWSRRSDFVCLLVRQWLRAKLPRCRLLESLSCLKPLPSGLFPRTGSCHPLQLLEVTSLLLAKGSVRYELVAQESGSRGLRKPGCPWLQCRLSSLRTGCLLRVDPAAKTVGPNRCIERKTTDD